MLSLGLISLSLFAAAAQAGKRGLCWPWYNGPLNPWTLNNGSGEVVAIYDWETYQPPSNSGSDGGLDFIGMQRCLDCGSSPIAELASRSETQGWDTVFTLNEPDIDPAGITPSQAASWYIQYINTLSVSKRALPAVTSSSESGQGLSWLSEMIAACNGQCKYDYCNLHWYGTSFSQFQSYIENANVQFPNCPFVITEFALQNPPGGQADQLAFFEQAFAFLDSASYVATYFPFVATSPSLFSANDGAGASGVGTGSCLFNDDGTASPVGQLLMSASSSGTVCPSKRA